MCSARVAAAGGLTTTLDLSPAQQQLSVPGIITKCAEVTCGITPLAVQPSKSACGGAGVAVLLYGRTSALQQHAACKIKANLIPQRTLPLAASWAFGMSLFSWVRRTLMHAPWWRPTFFFANTCTRAVLFNGSFLVRVGIKLKLAFYFMFAPGTFQRARFIWGIAFHSTL